MKQLAKWRAMPDISLWFLTGLLMMVLFLLVSGLLASGVLLLPTLQQEQWLFTRPLTRMDCTLLQWKIVGEIPISLLITLALGVLCVRLGYRKRVPGYLLLLLGLCLCFELGGKALFSMKLPDPVRRGMTGLTCPQLHGTSRTTQFAAAFAIWPLIPAPPPQEVEQMHRDAQAPLSFDSYTRERGYPGGHAMRFCFLGLLMCWLAGRHMRRPYLRLPVMLLMLIITLGGALLPFYIGVHTLTDTIGGSLCGTAAACCAIGLLKLHDGRRKIQ